jgi:hypothetical protein
VAPTGALYLFVNCLRELSPATALGPERLVALCILFARVAGDALNRCPLHFPQSGSDHSLLQPDSLPDFVELARGLQQVELGLLALKIGVEVEHPFFIFCEAGALDVAQVDFALVQLRLQNGHILLG